MSRVPNGSEAGSTTGLFRDDTVAVPRVSIDWGRSVPWWRLLSQSLSISWRASHLILSGVAFLVIFSGWWLGAKVFDPPGLDLSFTDWKQASFQEIGGTAWYMPLLGWLGQFDKPLTLRHAAYLAFGVLWTISAGSFFGGLLARRSLMEMGNRTSVGWIPSLRLVRRRWTSMIWSTTMPLVAIGGLALIPLVLGLIARGGTVGQTVALVLLIPTSMLSIAVGWCAIISLFGFSLSVCAIVGEKKADAFDGLSRSAAYVFQRPMTIACIVAFSYVLSTLGTTVISLVLLSGQRVVWTAFEVGYGQGISNAIGDSGSNRHFLYWIGASIITLLQAGFVFSFFWSSSAAAYLTLRYEIDHTDFDELDLQEIGEPVPMPTVKQNENGVTEVLPAEATATDNGSS